MRSRRDDFQAQLRVAQASGPSPGQVQQSVKRIRILCIGGIDGQRSGVMQSSQVFAIFCIEVDMLARFVAFSLVIGSLFALAGCNTVDGVGQDISGAARTVKRAL
ncbi:hypothetical protein [Pandoraea oxalativorans]|nr:hypothetical protein [Pandoraea oxalativorans]